VAVSWSERPRAKLVCGAVTAMLCSTAAVTVSEAVAERELRVAVMVELPVARVLMRPVLLTVALEGAEELH